jgi:ankyrin repeat protein
MNCDTGLLRAAAEGRLQDVHTALLQEGVNVNATDPFDETALMIVSRHGHVDIVFELLNHHDKLDVNHRNEYGITALVWASKNGYKEIVDLLLKHDEIVELLKRGNVTMNLQTKSGHTALSLASIHGNTDIVWELLKHDPCEALAWAITKCHAKNAGNLEEHGKKNTSQGRSEAIRFGGTRRKA